MADPFLARFSSVPALVAAEAGPSVSAHLAALAASEHGHEIMRAGLSGDDFWSADDWRARFRPYVVRDGVLLIPVKGVLMHDFPYAFGSWATGYDYIWKAVERGLADFVVKGIAFVIDSPGGEVPGCFDLVDKIYAARGAKPMRAFAAESATSAAYAIASAAEWIIVARTGRVGSIGVVTSHVDLSRAVEDRGIKVTFIYAGEHKVDGNPFEPLPDEVKARIQARVDHTYGLFTRTVARNRAMEVEAVRGTEALIYTADEAVANGLADGIGAFDQAVAAFAAELEPQPLEDDEMSTANDTFDQAAVDAARAAGVTEGAGLGAVAERTRITAILGSEAGKKRPAAALSAALKTDMTAEQAVAFIADLPEEGKPAEAPQAGAGHLFDKAMGKDNPNLGAGDGSDPERSQLDTILGDYRAMTGAEKRPSI